MRLTLPLVEESLQRVVAADRFAPARTRQLLRAWLAGLDWPSDDTDDLVLAVNEAISNIVDHAYLSSPGPRLGILTCTCERVDELSRRIRIGVTDYGQWRPPPADSEGRRRGIPMMRGCTDFVGFQRTATGTQVIMVSRPVRLPGLG